MSTKIDNTEHVADLLKCLKEIGGDLEFLHGIFIEDEDFDRKVQIATPYLEAKINFINDLLDDYSKFLPDELRKGLGLEERK